MRRGFSFSRLGLRLAGVAVSAAAILTGGAQTKSPLSIYFEAQLPYYYEGDPLPVAITVKNATESTVDNKGGLDILGGLQVADARGTRLKPVEGLSGFITQPPAVEQGGFFGRIVEVNRLFPGLLKAGNYTMSWRGEGATSNTLVLRVVPLYDPKKDYRARLETDFGPIVVEFAKATAPRHVRNFIDLARQGFYNANQFHRVLKGQAIIGGSPTGDPGTGSGYNLEPELADLPVEAGTVLQVRNKNTAPDDSGSHFMITAIAKPDFQGKLTVLGKVVEGLDTVKTICQVPTEKEPRALPGAPERPVKQILIRKVTIGEVAPPGEAKPAAAKKKS